MSKTVVMVYGDERAGLDRLLDGEERVAIYRADEGEVSEAGALPYGRCIAFTVTALFEDEED